MSVSIIIPAGGSSRRFEMDGKKQFMFYLGWSLLRWSIEPLLSLGPKIKRIVIAFPEEDIDIELPGVESLSTEIHRVAGGKRRQDSVFNCMKHLHELGDDGIWLVHDAARPLLFERDLEKLIRCIEEKQCGALLATPAKDTIKRSENGENVSETVDRSTLWQAQTPQGAPAKIMWEANLAAIEKNLDVSDDASILEAHGVEVKLVKGSANNIKITTADDWQLFTRLAKR